MSIIPPRESADNRPAHLTPTARSLLRADLARLAERFAEADSRAFRAAILANGADLEAAEAEKREAAGAFWLVA